MSPLPYTIIRCRPPLTNAMFCSGQGKCIRKYIRYRVYSRPYCECYSNFHGKHCEKMFDSSVYGFNRAENELEDKTISTLSIILMLMIFGFLWCLFLHRRLVRNAQKQCLDDEIEHSNEEHRSAAMEYTPDAIQFSLISATEINTENVQADTLNEQQERSEANHWGRITEIEKQYGFVGKGKGKQMVQGETNHSPTVDQNCATFRAIFKDEQRNDEEDGEDSTIVAGLFNKPNKDCF